VFDALLCVVAAAAGGEQRERGARDRDLGGAQQALTVARRSGLS
jgi:hypothetical protein